MEVDPSQWFGVMDGMGKKIEEERSRTKIQSNEIKTTQAREDMKSSLKDSEYEILEKRIKMESSSAKQQQEFAE